MPLRLFDIHLPVWVNSISKLVNMFGLLFFFFSLMPVKTFLQTSFVSPLTCSAYLSGSTMLENQNNRSISIVSCLEFFREHCWFLFRNKQLWCTISFSHRPQWDRADKSSPKSFLDNYMSGRPQRRARRRLGKLKVLFYHISGNAIGRHPECCSNALQRWTLFCLNVSLKRKNINCLSTWSCSF